MKKRLLSLFFLIFCCPLGSCAPALAIESKEDAFSDITKTEPSSADESAETFEEYPQILPGTEGEIKLRIVSFNIRRPYDVDTGVRSWAQRRDVMAQYLRGLEADVICLQEAVTGYYNDLKKVLSDEFLFSLDIPNLIMYRKDRFDLLEEGQFYLSETPEIKSVGWDAKNERSCQYVLLNEKESGARFFVFNTHFDHVGIKARMESAKLVLERIKCCEYPSVLCGDINSMEENYPYMYLTEVLRDTRKEAAVSDHGTTINNWGARADADASQIDFCFVSPVNLEVESFSILRDRWGSGNFYSDHYAVKSDMRLLY